MATTSLSRSSSTIAECDAMCVKPLLAFLGAVIGCLVAGSAVSADPVPACRLDDSMAGEVRETVERATATYQALGKPLPFSRVEVNPKTAAISDATLTVWVVRDASKGAVDAARCSNRPAAKDEELDDLSVRGGCFVAAVGKPEIRCSDDAVKLFADRGNGGLQPNPALLYVLAHELAHVLQKRAGEYSGRAVTLTVSRRIRPPGSSSAGPLRPSLDPARGGG